jgi:mRNA interferase MazF
MAIVCPVTHTDKNHPFHVKLNYQTATKGVILCDQVRTLDVYAREAELIEQLPDDEVLDIITGFFAIAEINAV